MKNSESNENESRTITEKQFKASMMLLKYKELKVNRHSPHRSKFRVPKPLTKDLDLSIKPLEVNEEYWIKQLDLGEVRILVRHDKNGAYIQSNCVLYRNKVTTRLNTLELLKAEQEKQKQQEIMLQLFVLQNWQKQKDMIRYYG